jgi:hypothetical protein
MYNVQCIRIDDIKEATYGIDDTNRNPPNDPEMEVTEIILAKALRLCQLSSQSWVSF